MANSQTDAEKRMSTKKEEPPKGKMTGRATGEGRVQKGRGTQGSRGEGQKGSQAMYCTRKGTQEGKIKRKRKGPGP